MFLQIIAILAPEVAERSCSLSHYIEWTGVRVVHLELRVESLEFRVFVPLAHGRGVRGEAVYRRFFERYLTGYQTAAQPTKRTVTKMSTRSQG